MQRDFAMKIRNFVTFLHFPRFATSLWILFYFMPHLNNYDLTIIKMILMASYDTYIIHEAVM